jgi:hypothetical protein
LWRWICNEARLAAVGALLDLAFIVGKRYGTDSLWQFLAYRPHYSVRAYFEASAHHLSQLFYDRVTLSPWHMALLLAGMLALAALTRRRCLLWAAGFVWAGVLPLAFIFPRAGFAYYVPSIGWAVYVSALLGWLLERLTPGRGWLRAAQALLFAFLVIKVAPVHAKYIKMSEKAAHDGMKQFHLYHREIRSLIVNPRKGARVLLLSDGEGRDDWDLYFLVRLSYGDHSLVVSRLAVLQHYHVAVNPKDWDYRLDCAGGHMVLR